MGSIPLSKEHGLNPSIQTCFWCGESMGIALLGKLKGDAKAPMQAVYNYEPCDKCQSSMSLGITLIEAISSQLSDKPEIQKGLSPTGRWLVMKEEAVTRGFNEETVEGMLKYRKAFIDQTIFDMIIGKED